MRRAVDDGSRIHLGVGESLVEHPRLQIEARRIESDKIEWTVFAECDAVGDLALAEDRGVLSDDDVGDDGGRSFVDRESDTDLLASAPDDRGIDFSLAISALPVEDADAQHVAVQLLVVEVFASVEVFRFADQAKRL